jgi:hypothetical protein
MVQESSHLRRAEVLRVTFAGKKDKSLYPVEISLLRAVAVVTAPDGIAHLIEQPRRLVIARHRFRLIRVHSEGNVLTAREDDMTKLQIGGLRSASFHS